MCGKIFTNLGRANAYAGCQTMLCVRLDEDFRIEHKGAFVSVAFYFVSSPCLSSCPQIIRRETNALFFCCVLTLSLFCAIWQIFFRWQNVDKRECRRQSAGKKIIFLKILVIQGLVTPFIDWNRMCIMVHFFYKIVYTMILWASVGGKIKKNKCKFTCFF